MHLRPITREDLPALVTIFCDAFANEGLFAFQFPYREQYPLAWRHSAWQKHLFHLNCPGRYGFVCVADETTDNAQPGEILGYAWWFRRLPKHKDPSTDPYTQNNLSFASTLDRLLRTVEAKYWNLFNPILAPSTNHIIQRAIYSTDLFAPLANTPYWHLSALATAPQHQRKGVAARLLEWGIEQAKEESARHPDQPPVPVGLHASGSGHLLYSKKGFRVIGWKLDVFDEWAKEMYLNREMENIYERAMGLETIKGGGCGMLYDDTGFWTCEPAEVVMSNGRPVERVWTQDAINLGQSK